MVVSVGHFEKKKKKGEGGDKGMVRDQERLGEK